MHWLWTLSGGVYNAPRVPHDEGSPRVQVVPQSFIRLKSLVGYFGPDSVSSDRRQYSERDGVTSLKKKYIAPPTPRPIIHATAHFTKFCITSPLQKRDGMFRFCVVFACSVTVVCNTSSICACVCVCVTLMKEEMGWACSKRSPMGHGIPRCRWEGNTEMELNEIWLEDCVLLAPASWAGIVTSFLIRYIVLRFLRKR